MLKENNPLKIAFSLILKFDKKEMLVNPEQIIIGENGKSLSCAGENTRNQKICDQKRHIFQGIVQHRCKQLCNPDDID